MLSYRANRDENSVSRKMLLKFWNKIAVKRYVFSWPNSLKFYEFLIALWNTNFSDYIEFNKSILKNRFFYPIKVCAPLNKQNMIEKKWILCIFINLSWIILWSVLKFFHPFLILQIVLDQSPFLRETHKSSLIEA